MVLFLIPVAVVGYKVWDHHQKKKEGRQAGEEEATNSSGEPSRVVDTLPCDDGASGKHKHNLQKENNKDSAGETAEVASLNTTDNVGSFGSSSDDEYDDQTTERGALGGFRKFWEGKMDDLRARELQKNKQRELAMKIANGSVALPKISYK